MPHYLKFKTQVALRKLAQWFAQRDLSNRRELWQELQAYLQKTSSTGCNLTDYWHLYYEIRKNKPIEVLECGTGVSTLVIAHALIDNEKETGVKGRVTSMEEIDEWLEMSRRLLPDKYHPYVDFSQSDTVEDCFSIFRGVRYRNIPARMYDFVFVDGPKYKSPVDGVPTFDFDFIQIVRDSERPVSGLIDKRVSTCFVLQQILGAEKVRYDPVLHLGYIAPCTKHDLGRVHEQLSSENFQDSFGLFYKSKLSMCPLTRTVA